MTTASILPYAIGASTAFLAALGYATMLVAWWNRLPAATRTAYPRIGHYVVIVARLLPVAQGIGTAIHGMLTGAPVVSLPTVAPTPVQASRPSMVPPLAVLAAARMALCALVLVVTVLAFGCKSVDSALLTATPGIAAPSGCTPLAYQCDTDMPQVCSSSGRWWAVLPPDSGGHPQHCASGCVLSAGIAHCAGVSQ